MRRRVIVALVTLALASVGASTGFRSRNDAVQGNVFYNISPRLVLGVEVSRWRTDWVGLPNGRVVRVEPTIFYVF
jgi:hypothetical protein